MVSNLFRGIAASTVTPFGSDGRPDLSLLPPHVEWIINEGANALSPLGSSGEFCGLSKDDRKRVIEAVAEINNGRLPIVAGTHAYSTQDTIELSQHAESAGAQALLIVPPYYMAPTPTQTMEHYRRIADAVSIPIVLYHNIPLTAIDLRTHHLVKMFEDGSIGGVKMSNPEPDRVCELLHATDGELAVYAGIDTVAFEGLCHGAHGWISGIPSIAPRVASEMYQAIAERKDIEAGRAIWAKLAPLMRMQFASYLAKAEGPHWFSIMKAALNMIGPPVGDPLPPVLPLAEEHRGELAGHLARLGYETHAAIG